MASPWRRRPPPCLGWEVGREAVAGSGRRSGRDRRRQTNKGRGSEMKKFLFSFLRFQRSERFPQKKKIRTFGLQIGTAQRPHLTRGFGPIVSKLSQTLDHRHDDKASARRGPGWPTETSLAVEGAQEEDRGGRRWREEGYGGRQSRDPTKPGPSQKKRKFPRSHV
jgi:hypothetical protein